MFMMKKYFMVVRGSENLSISNDLRHNEVLLTTLYKPIMIFLSQWPKKQNKTINRWSVRPSTYSYVSIVDSFNATRPFCIIGRHMKLDDKSGALSSSILKNWYSDNLHVILLFYSDILICNPFNILINQFIFILLSKHSI